MNFIQKFLLKVESNKIEKTNKGNIDSNVLFTNDYINLVHDACVISHGGKTDKLEEEKEKFISKIVGFGHESVLEHSNIITGFKFDKSYMESLLVMLPYLHYLRYKIAINKNTINLLIGGSARGYKNAIREFNTISLLNNMGNVVIRSFISKMYLLKPCLFEDFIDFDILNIKEFNKGTVVGDIYKYSGDDTEDDEESYYNDIIKGQKVDISSIDNIDHIKKVCDEFFGRDIFSIYDLFNITSITVLFKDCSRAASHQLVRHRNAITQASQRYIDISNINIHTPEEFKTIYDSNKKYKINFVNDNKTLGVETTFKDLAKTMGDIYSQLRNQEVLKEDARYFSLNGTSTSLYMTFTLQSLVQFLMLRTAKDAQSEIRLMAIELENMIKNYMDENIKYTSYSELYIMNKKDSIKNIPINKSKYYDVDDVLN